MAKVTEALVGGVLTQVTEFDHSAQEIDDAVENLESLDKDFEDFKKHGNLTPTAHASTHAADGNDPITPAMIGAYSKDETYNRKEIERLTNTSGGLLPQILSPIITGFTITCIQGDTTLSPQEADGFWIFDIPEYGAWTITVWSGEEVVYSETIQVDAVKQYILQENPEPRYTMLYYMGDECSDVTGGFKTASFNNYTEWAIKKEETAIYVKGGSAGYQDITAVTNKEIDPDTYSCLCAFIVDSGTPTSNNFGWKSFTIGTSDINTSRSDSTQILTAFDKVTNKICTSNQISKKYPFIGHYPGSHVRFSAMWYAKPDDWTALCNVAGVTSPASLSALVADTAALTAILSDMKAVYHMCLYCCGDFLVHAIQSSTFLAALEASPYKELVYANEHWAKFLALVA